MRKLYRLLRLSTCRALLLLLSSSACFASNGNTQSADSNAIKVKTVAYRDIAINVTHSQGATVPAIEDSTISAQISAIINSFHVDTGYEVQQGDLLVSLDCRENRLKLQQAEAVLNAETALLNHAVTQFRQAKQLDKQGNISKELYSQREAEEKRLQASVNGSRSASALAQINVDRCQISAPFHGYISRRYASRGELTQPGSALLQLVSNDGDLVEASINNRLLGSFTDGKEHRFEFDDQSYPLTIEHVLPVLDSNSRNHTARLRFVNARAATGSVGKVSWRDTKTSIPAEYIVMRDGQYGVMVAEENHSRTATARFIPIPGATEGQPAPLALDKDTQIISTGRFNTRHGDILQISNQDQ